MELVSTCFDLTLKNKSLQKSPSVIRNYRNKRSTCLILIQSSMLVTLYNFISMIKLPHFSFISIEMKVFFSSHLDKSRWDTANKKQKNELRLPKSDFSFLNATDYFAKSIHVSTVQYPDCQILKQERNFFFSKNCTNRDFVFQCKH